MSKKEARSLFRFLKLVIFLDYVPLFKPRSQELWLLLSQIQITSKIIQVFLRNPVWLIATCSWICRLNIFQRYWLGRILLWRHFFIWWGKKIIIYWRCGYKKIIWMGNGSYSRSKVGIFDLFPRRCIEISYISLNKNNNHLRGFAALSKPSRLQSWKQSWKLNVHLKM